MRQVLSDRLDDAADMASIAARPQSPDEVSPLQIEILTPEIADLGPEPLSTEPSSPSKKAILSAANSLGLQLNPDKVGPHNFAKIRNLGAGSSGRVYLVKSIVRASLFNVQNQVLSRLLSHLGTAHRRILCHESRQEERACSKESRRVQRMRCCDGLSPAECL